MTFRSHLIALSLIALTALPAGAEPLARQLFGAKSQPSAHAPQPIGFYSRGCAAGLLQMPETGATWQAMRLSRNRNWGQPEMLGFLQDLSRFAARQPGWKGLYVGDIAQPRGGPMTGGHASHQTGLDADIWMLPPKSLTLSRQQREAISSISVRSGDQRRTNSNWTEAHKQILRAAAMDDRVDRIFVAAAVKIDMCNSTPRNDRKWLQKIRPYWGHNTHFHVRLNCPKGARYCETQKPTVRELSKGGDGCDATLNWWVTDALNPPKTAPKPAQPKGPPKRNAKTYVMSDLPTQCRSVLSANSP
ncbi:penicillin-insensitive murein endopeptidase [Thioclava sp. SK-1]|uniref:penicillin-insensitive murein endopeptidase n=1 Tax=Thioclava sp. SK-1 TaxID=1889770 RepID=UPI000826512E|nr:penicillin-insensitive murein endopeptidase [Thioclava sp. SK-1]OCX65811.1 penicillin-insensitive murein endopeptidase [Thioclava sp. SK-1]